MQGRKAKGEDIQAIEEVFPESPSANPLLEIFATDGDETQIDGPLPASERGKATLGQEAQELGLGRDRHLLDVIEQQGAPFGPGHTALFPGLGAGEGTSLVPEEFTLQEGRGQTSRVDLDQRPLDLGTTLMQSPGKGSPPCAGLAQDQDRSTTSCNAL